MRKVIFLALAVSGALSLLALFGHPYVYADQALQLTCVQSWQHGETAFPNWVVAADPTDLSRDRFTWEIWHAPGFPILVAALTRLGFSFGGAIELIATVCFIAGCVGWSLWALRFDLSRALQLAIPLVIAGIRYGNDTLVHFHAEAFLFAATPWLLLAALRLISMPRISWPWLLFLGGMLGGLFLLKYSGLLVIAGILALFVGRTRLGWLAALIAAVPILTFSLINRAWGGAENLVIASWHLHFFPGTILLLTGAIPLTLADAGQIFEAAFPGGRYDIFHPPWLLLCLGLPGFFFLLTAFLRKGRWSEIETLTLLFALTNLALMFVIWMLSDGVGYDRRYLAPASLALLPLAFTVTLAEFNHSAFRHRIAAMAFLGFYLLLPIAYGYGTFLIKARDSAGSQPTASHLWNPVLADRDGRGVDDFLNAQHREGDVWYFPEPLFALDLPGRRIFGRATWSLPQPDEAAYRTSQSLRILALASQQISDGDARTYLTRIFPQSSAWTAENVPLSNYVLWIGQLRP